MASVSTAIVATSTLLLVIWAAWQLTASVSRLKPAIGILLLLVYLVVVHLAFDFPSLRLGLAKGVNEPSSGPLVLAMFVFMLFGMAAEYLYHYLDAPEGVASFKWQTFAKPFLISPLVFVPLAASLQNAKVDLTTFSVPVLMLYLVAFENGFLWRGYFTRKLAQS